MQIFVKKFALGAMVAGAALAVSACGSNDTTPVDNSAVDLNATTDMSMDGLANDATSLDAAAGADMNVTDANALANEAAPAADATTNTTNAM